MPDDKEQQAEDARRGRRLRKFLDYCVDKPSVPGFLVFFLFAGLHPALQFVGLEQEPIHAASEESTAKLRDLEHKLDVLESNVGGVRVDVKEIKNQVHDLQGDILRLALRANTEPKDSDPRLASQPLTNTEAAP